MGHLPNGAVSKLAIRGLCLLIVAIFRFGMVLRAAELPPNVLIIMADDLGFSDLGCYGSEIETPHLDQLAASGTIFSDFHAAPTCSPTRAMLLTGVDHHLAGMGNMYEFLRTAPAQWGKPGYEGYLNDSVLTIAEVLKPVGYETAIAGKWHLGQQLVASQAPIGRGFDHSWVLWTGWSENYEPPPQRTFVADDRRVAYPQGTYSTQWYTDKALEFIDLAREHQKPFFVMVTYTAPHWPLEAPAELIEKYAARYERGFDEWRTRRIDGLTKKGLWRQGGEVASTPALAPPLHHAEPVLPTRRWTEMSAAERTYSARQMAVHAAMIDAMDSQIGRLLDHLNKHAQLENTLIVFLSDNGASSLLTPADEPGNQLANVGRPGSYVAYGSEWARASSGPLRLMKGYPSEGGTRVPTIIKLPGKQQQPRIIHEFASVLDVAPTIYELTGATYPDRHDDRRLHPLEGTSLLAGLTGQRPTLRLLEPEMGWELFGRTGYRRGRWKITWMERPFGTSGYELYDLEVDPGEAKDLSVSQPERLAEMVTAWEKYAQEKGVVVVRKDDLVKAEEQGGE